MKLRQPKITALIKSSGKIICKNATCLNNAKKGARCIARILQKQFSEITFSNYKIVKIYSTFKMQSTINLELLASSLSKPINSKPELYQALVIRFSNFKITLKIFPSGSVKVISTSECHTYAQKVIRNIYPYLQASSLNVS